MDNLNSYRTLQLGRGVEALKHSTPTNAFHTFLTQVAAWAPTIVALLGILVALIQYLRDQKRQRNLRIEERVAENLSTLARFPADATMPLAVPTAALYSLQVLVGLSTAQETYRAQITNVIAAAVREDLDFTTTNHVRFDQLCLKEWKPYAAIETELVEDNISIISRYIAAVKVAANENPGLVRHIKMVNQVIIGVPQGTPYRSLRHLIYLIDGYSVRASLLPESSQREVDQSFQQSTGNDSLSQYIQQQRIGHNQTLLELLPKTIY